MDGAVFAFSSSLQKNGAFTDEAKKFMNTNNIKSSGRMTKNVTHMLVTAEDLDNDSEKLLKHQNNGVKLILSGFIEECIKKGKVMASKKYERQVEEEKENDENQPIRKSSRITATNDKIDSQNLITNNAAAKRSNGKKQSEDDEATKVDSQNSSDKKSNKKKKSDEDEDEPAKAAKVDDQSKGATQKQKLVKQIIKGKAAVDMYVTDSQSFYVFEDSSGLYDAMLNQTNIGQNNNKFYLLQLLKNEQTGAYSVWKRWGRVGADGQRSMDSFPSLDAAKRNFTQKFQEKTQNRWEDRDSFVKFPKKYYYLPKDYEEVVPEKENVSLEPRAESKLDLKVQQLIQLICNIELMKKAMMEIGYDANKMPLGKLSKDTISKGFNVLEDIAKELKKKKKDKSQLVELSSLFYTVIPHSFGMSLPPVIDSLEMLKSKIEMVESLSDIEIATTLLKQELPKSDIHPIDEHYLRLNVSLNPLASTSPQYSIIQEYLVKTVGHTHTYYSLQLQDVFEVERDVESKRFRNLHNRKLLWHGSRITNFVGILSQGLRIAPPEAPSTGYMFGKGIYFADMVTKSANYCYASNANPYGILLLCEVALGDEHELHFSDYSADDLMRKKKRHSVKGVGKTQPKQNEWHVDETGLIVPCGTSSDFATTGALQYNEYIVYDVAQVKIRYLLKVKFDFK